MNNVYFVLKVRKNLVSNFLLNKFGFKQAYEGNKFILSEDSAFVGKGYDCGDTCELNVITSSSENEVNGFAYTLVHFVSFL